MPKKIEDVTQKIINAALEIYHREGYDSLSMRRIAEVSGLSVGTVYTHFDDKEALLAQVLAGEIEQIMNDFMRNVFGKEPKEALYGAIYCFIARMVETPQDRPSRPSIRLTALVIAVIQSTVTNGASTPNSIS